MGIFNIFKKQEQLKREILKTYVIEFPYRGIIGNVDLEEEENEEYIFGKDVYSYLDQESIDGINMSWNGSNMTEFIEDKQLKNKIADMELSIKDNGICHIYIKVYEELTKDDKDYILKFVKGQASGGWGEGNFDYIYDKNTKEVCFYWDSEEKAEDENCIPFSISFWWYDNSWYIKYVEGSN